MRKIVYTSTAVKTLILIIAVILLLLLYPFRAVKYRATDEVPPTGVTSSNVIDRENFAQQIFIASKEHLGYLKLYLTEDNTPGTEFTVKLTDMSQKQLAIETVTVPDALPGYVEILMDVDTVPAQDHPYFFRVEVPEDSEAALHIGLMPWGSNPNVIAVAYYNEVPLEGMNYAADYVYTVPLNLPRALFYIGVVLLFLFTGLSITDATYTKDGVSSEKDRILPVETVMKKVCNPLAALLILGCIAAVILGLVSMHRLDNCFALIAIALLALILFYGINHDRTGMDGIITADYIREHLPDLFQSLAVALALRACCEYVSGLYDIHHRVAERKEMFWFCLVIIAMFRMKDILTVYNLIYAGCAVIAGVLYYRAHLTPEMTPDDLFVLKMTVVIAALTGFILIRTLRGLWEKRLARINPLYGIVTALYFLAIILFRNTRWWTVVLAVAFTLLFLNYGMWEHKERFLTNVVRGAVLQFLLLTGYALLHRPYSTYRSARYTHYFHTATITATYMTLICCVALVMVLYKIYRIKRDEKDTDGKGLLRHIWKELLFFGIVSSYLIFTMARTAYAAMVVTALFALLVLTFGKGRDRMINYGKNLGLLLLTLLIVLPVVFEVQRTLPALASDPVTYDIEAYTDDTLRGHKLNSNEYMRVGRFVDVFADKILSVPEGTFDIYGEIEEFKRTHPDGVTYVPEGEDTSCAGEVLFASADRTGSLRETADALIRYEDEGEISYEDVYGEVLPDDDYTNGRLDIYRSYLSQMNMTGHETMGATLKNGEIATHAHDVYLQVAYDHGIPVGILFVLFGILTFVTGILCYRQEKDRIPYAALPMVLTLSFATAGLVEWVYHLSHPMSFVLLLTITPLVFFRQEGRKETASRDAQP